MYSVHHNKVNNIDEISSTNNNEFLNTIKDEPQFKKMINTLPWTVDNIDFNHNHWNTIDNSMREKSHIFVVTETLFLSGRNNMFLTEKTFKPILMRMPFIILGNVDSLKYLRSLGYKTFSHIWDENYDNIEDCSLRMVEILKLVKSLSELSDQEFQEKMIEADKISEYNYNVMMSRRAESDIIKLLMGDLCKLQ
jgi:hypothetical protein